MRSTLTVQDEVDSRLRGYAQAEGISYKEAVNRALDAGLERLCVREGPVAYTITSFDAGVRPELDQTRLNQLLDDPDFA